MVAVHGFRTPPFEGIDERASIHPTATLGADARVSSFVTIAPNVTIGERAVIYPGVCIGENSRIGDDCILYPNVVLYDGCILGDRVTIHANSSIGQDGFGYATHAGDDGVVRHEKIPQVGWVEIGDDVEIGADCAVDRATMGPTVIGEGTKFSNLITIGHGTKMGKHCLVVALCGLGGSTMVGNYCVFGGQSGSAGHLSIGDGVRVGGRTAVTSDIAPGLEVLGMPAIPLSEARRSMSTLRHLPKMRKAMGKLIRDVAALQRQLGLDGEADDGADKDS
jgi:UDP-3-O-[3-hydroxymyristoyl] glucosamine N-acyltransferase